MKSLIKAKTKKGFSLVELLVVIAVIGVIAAIAIPAMSGIFGQADSAKSRRNAQGIATLYASARAAGQTVSVVSPAATIAALDAGVVVPAGVPLAGTTFQMELSAPEQTAAAAMLVYNAGSDSYSVLAP